MKKSCPNTPFVLCGTKIDLRDDPATVAKLEAEGEKPISFKIVCILFLLLYNFFYILVIYLFSVVSLGPKKSERY